MCGVGLCVGLCVVCRGDVCVSSCTGVFESTHGNVLNVHTGAYLSSLLASLSSRVSLSLLLVSLSFCLFSLTNNDKDHSSSRLSLYAQQGLIPSGPSRTGNVMEKDKGNEARGSEFVITITLIPQKSRM